MDNRRAFKRLPAEAKVLVRPLDSKETTMAAGKDLSGGGIQFMCNDELKVGSLADIEVRHPGNVKDLLPLRAVIRVVRVQGDLPPYEIAGAFIEVR
jgi:hypothetical protein